MMKISFTAATHVGQKRKRNEDFFQIIPEKNVMILCDGMGGLNAGDVASKSTTKTIADIYSIQQPQKLISIYTDLDASLPPEVKLMITTIRLANRRIIRMISQIPGFKGQMGTTVEIVHFIENKILIGHVGDSRVYRLRHQELTQMTDDHSWINELLQDKEISKEEAENFRARNVITRALGVKPTVKIDVITDTIEQGDLFLVCSDGLTGPVNDTMIKNIVADTSANLDQKVENLIAQANQNGGPDNITVTLAEVISTDAPTTAIKKTLITIPEEADLIVAAEDKLLDEIYGQVKQEKRKRSKKPVYACIVSIVIVFIFYTLFLNQNDVTVSPQNESDQIEMIHQLTAPESHLQQDRKEGKIRFVVWTSENKQAEVFIDGKPVGKVNDNYDEGFNVAEGNHTITLHLNTKIIFQDTIKISEKTEALIEID